MKLAIIFLSLLTSPCFGILLHQPNSETNYPGCIYYIAATRILQATTSATNSPQESPKNQRKKILKKQLLDQSKKPKKD